MSGKLGRFLRWVGFIFLAIIGTVISLLFLKRGPRFTSGDQVKRIEDEARKEREKIREEIKSENDAALVDRFNKLRREKP